MQNRIRLLACLIAFGVVVWPSTAAGKQGAMLDPQLSALPVGHPTRAELLILPASRNSPFGARQIVPAPAAGSVPVVTLRLPGSHVVLRFTGAPLDRRGRSVVWITLPASIDPQRWKVWVLAAGRIYPDLIDSSTIDHPAPPAPAAGGSSEIKPPLPATRSHRSALPGWLFVLGGVALAAAAGSLALNRARRAGGMLARTARR